MHLYRIWGAVVEFMSKRLTFSCSGLAWSFAIWRLLEWKLNIFHLKIDMLHYIALYIGYLKALFSTWINIIAKLHGSVSMLLTWMIKSKRTYCNAIKSPNFFLLNSGNMWYEAEETDWKDHLKLNSSPLSFLLHILVNFL